MANLAENPQYPLNAMGNKGVDAFLGVQKTFFSGATGLVATSYGVPGWAISSRVSTGSYNITFPPTVAVDIIPGVQAPSGHAYTVNISDVQPTSGTAKLQIGRFGSFGSSGNAVPSMTFHPQVPVSGTRVNLLIFGSPRFAY